MCFKTVLMGLCQSTIESSLELQPNNSIQRMYGNLYNSEGKGGANILSVTTQYTVCCFGE